jgi:single-stranded DNA-binding protein
MIRTIVEHGRLTHDPLMKRKGDLDICEMRVAEQRPNGPRGEDNGAVFVTVTAFGRQALACGRYLRKASRISVPDARLEHGEWTDEKEQRHERHTIVARRVLFLDPPPAREQADAPAEPESAPADVAEPIAA